MRRYSTLIFVGCLNLETIKVAQHDYNVSSWLFNDNASPRSSSDFDSIGGDQPPIDMRPMPTIKLPRSLVNQLLHQAQLAADREVCGLIGAREREPVRCYPVANVASSPQVRYVMDPKAQIDALRQMRERGEELFAIYHSHPVSPALPSAMDIDEAAYPGVLYLIISLNTKGVLEMRGFRLTGRDVAEVMLELQ